ncbi:zinc ribbon domain-containing protein [bacterium]|nr:zinc ribbon domain-containing protein [bacterium]
MNSTQPLESQPRQVSPQQARALDAFCRGLEQANALSIREGLLVLAQLVGVSASQGSHWQGRWTPCPFEPGGILALHNSQGEDHLSLSQDARGAFFCGTWSGCGGERIFELSSSNELQLLQGAQSWLVRLEPLELAWARPGASAPHCHHCARTVEPQSRYCIHCGTPLERLCPGCRARLEPDHRFCGRCGAPAPRS